MKWFVSYEDVIHFIFNLTILILNYDLWFVMDQDQDIYLNLIMCKIKKQEEVIMIYMKRKLRSPPYKRKEPKWSIFVSIELYSFQTPLYVFYNLDAKKIVKQKLGAVIYKNFNVGTEVFFLISKDFIIRVQKLGRIHR
jgi:hypothetical protein